MTKQLTWRHVFGDVMLGVGKMATVPLSRRKLDGVPRGAQQPVLILPGFLATDFFLRPLHQFLTSIGYRSYRWGLGRNLGYSHAYDIEEQIAQRIRQVLAHSGAPSLTLVGWSLGGVYAKALAHRYPELIREVITLGSPITGDVTKLALFSLYRWITGVRDAGVALNHKLCEIAAPLEGIPLMSIYSENDGIVPTANALQAEGAQVQNVIVDATHLGMAYDPYVYFLIAHRLAQSGAAEWQSLDAVNLRERFLSSPNL